MYNTFASFALLGWIPVSLVLFARLRPPVAATLVFLGAFLLLPATLEFDFPGLPGIDRHAMAGIGALLGYFLFVPNSSKSKLTTSWPLWLIAIYISCGLVTVLLNGDPTLRGLTYMPGLRLYDGLGVTFSNLITLAMPFYLGMKLIRNIDDLTVVLRIIAVEALVTAAHVHRARG